MAVSALRGMKAVYMSASYALLEILKLVMELLVARNAAQAHTQVN